jgi:hypothetical protein
LANNSKPKIQNKKTNHMKNKINHNGIEVINLESIRSSKYEDTVERLGEHSDTCFVCGKRTAKNTFVHYTVEGYLIPADIDEIEIEFRNLESQGCFPIGSECAKKVGRQFLIEQK